MRFLILATTMGFLHLAVLAAGGQTPGIPSSGPTKYGRIPEPTSTVKREPSTQAQKLEFRKVFQEYLKALKAFTEAYDASNGDVWPEKEAKALRKAWRAVQKVQPYLSDKADR